MKQMKAVFLILIAITFAAGACKKSDPSPDVQSNPKTVTPNISLSFNGTGFTSNAPVATYLKNYDQISIVGTFGTTSTISIGMTASIVAKGGSIDIAGGHVVANYSTGPNFSDSYFANSGNIVITSFTSSTITGTFHFEGTDTNNATGTVTNGSFSANYVIK